MRQDEVMVCVLQVCRHTHILLKTTDKLKWNKDTERQCHKQDTWQWVSPSLENKVIIRMHQQRRTVKKKEERRVKEACAVARGSGRLVLQLWECGFSSTTVKSRTRALSLNVHFQQTQLNQPKMVQGSTLWIKDVQKQDKARPFSHPLLCI